MKEVERTNIVIVQNFLQGQERRGERMRKNLYVMDINRDRNCYSCSEFEHLARNCRNKRIIGKERRLEHKRNENNR